MTKIVSDNAKIDLDVKNSIVADNDVPDNIRQRGYKAGKSVITRGSKVFCSYASGNKYWEGIGGIGWKPALSG